MEKKEQLWERLAPIVVEREDGFGNITVGGATDQQGKDNLLNFISQELDKAREEGKLEVLEELLEWDTPLEPIGKFMRLKTKMVYMKRDLLKLKQ